MVNGVNGWSGAQKAQIRLERKRSVKEMYDEHMHVAKM